MPVGPPAILSHNTSVKKIAHNPTVDKTKPIDPVSPEIRHT
jgi:hypothetical protein